MDTERQRSVVRVGIADMQAVEAPSTIRTSGLGSCVGVALYEEGGLTAALLHVMLPCSSLAKGAPANAAKFADTAIPAMVEQLRQRGVQPRKLRAKIAGGAQMFQFASDSESMRIGPRNVEAVKGALKNMSIPLIAEDTGGSSGRTIEFDPVTKLLSIRSMNQGVKHI